MPFDSLPELVALEAGAEGLRIPPDVTVPLTPRVRALIDTAEMHRLGRISQLGLVALVYPGAVHTRLEHSLGVYRLSLEFLGRLRHDDRFSAAISEADASALVVAALVHDIGHWAFCHPIEDMRLPHIPKHESLVLDLLAHGGPAAILKQQWGLDPSRVASLITGTATDPAGRMLHSLLSGPIDVDKMDYLSRDSLHAGVPYGRHFDQARLLSSLCLDGSGRSLAITDKGRTAAELLVVARYVMFSEVYWHHAVRSATAMLQRAVWIVQDRIEPTLLTRQDDRQCIEWLTAVAAGTAAATHVDGLFGPKRQLFKRAATFDALHHPNIHRALAGRSYADTMAVSQRLAERLSKQLGTRVAAETLLIDAPPAEREMEFNLQVCQRPGRNSAATPLAWRSLAELSPVVRSLAHEQFDNLVKRVRIFAPGHVASVIADCPSLDEIVLEVVEN